MATTVPIETTRHLRSRDGSKRSVNETGTELKSPTEEDAEMAAATTASHYLGCRGISSKRKLQDGLITIHNTPKRARLSGPSLSEGDGTGKSGEEFPDVYCWECHKECVEGALDCVSCPRTFHPDCLPTNSESSREPSESWTCPVCLAIMKAECADSRSWAMQQVNIDQLCTLFGFALQRMKHPDSEAFFNPVPKSLLPDYYDIVFHPMDLSTLDRNIKRKMYASTEAFIEDAKWILHNSMIYNGATSKYTADAKMIIKICKHEMSEIELCPDCYMNSCIRKDNWFAEPCTFPHCLVWAKLKGFPYWPAKALRVSASNNVDVRFFGAHDRAWIPVNQVYLLSEECPNPIKNVKKFGLDKAVDELQLHIRKLKSKPNVEFRYAPFKTEFKVEHLYNCSLLFGSSLSDEHFSVPENRAAHERRRQISGEDSISIANSEDLSERSMNSSANVDHSLLVEPSGSSTTLEENCPPPTDTPISFEPSSTIRKISTKAKKQISRPATSPEKSPKPANLNGSPNGAAVEPTITDDDNISVLEKIRLSMEHIDEEDNEDSNCSNNESQSFFQSLATAGVDAELDSTSKENTANFRPQSHTPDSASPVLDVPSPEENSHGVKLNGSSPNINKNAPLSSAGNVPQAQQSLVQQEPHIRKRNLQSVLEKMHSNVHLRCSASPSSDAGGGNLSGVSTMIQQTALKSKKKSKSSSVDKNTFIEKYSDQINNFLHATIESMLDEMQQHFVDGSPSSVNQKVQKKDESSNEILQEQFGKMKWFYQEAIRAMKNTAKVTFTELQQSIEAEKGATFEDSRKKFEEEMAAAVKEAKLKQWCANCGKEAVFYCCWNTSYCDYPCQQRHWPKHQATCAQIRSGGDANSMNMNIPSSSTMPHGNASFSAVTSSLQFASGAPGTPNNGGTPVVPVYAVPATGYYKTSAIPTGSAVALDLNQTNGQFIAIQPRTAQMTTSPNVAGTTIRRR